MTDTPQTPKPAAEKRTAPGRAAKNKVRKTSASKPGASKTGVVIVGMFSLFAAIAGGAIGGAAAWYLDETPSAPSSSSQIESLNARIDAQEQKIDVLDTALQAERKRSQALRDDITQMNSRMNASENAARTVAPMGVAVVEVPVGEPSEPQTQSLDPMGVAIVEVPAARDSAASERDGVIEMSKAAAPLPEQSQTHDGLPEGVNLPATAEDSSALSGEVAPDSVMQTEAVEVSTIDPVRMERLDLIASFPKAKLIAAIPAAQKPEGTIAALWRKHVQSGADASQDDRMAITRAEAALAREDIPGAIAALEMLSPDVRAAAQPWMTRAQSLIDD